MAIEECDCCGGKLPAPMDSAELDALNKYLTDEDGHCPGHLTVDATGQVLGCGAWSSEAYD